MSQRQQFDLHSHALGLHNRLLRGLGCGEYAVGLSFPSATGGARLRHRPRSRRWSPPIGGGSPSCPNQTIQLRLIKDPDTFHARARGLEILTSLLPKCQWQWRRSALDVDTGQTSVVTPPEAPIFRHFEGFPMLRRWFSRAVGLSQLSRNIPNLPGIMSSELLAYGRSSRRLRSVRPRAGAADPSFIDYGCERSSRERPNCLRVRYRRTCRNPKRVGQAPRKRMTAARGSRTVRSKRS